MSTKAWRRIYGSLTRVRFVASMPCCGCRHPSPSRNHHVRTVQNSGVGYKPDAEYIVPLCDWCHWELHDHGNESFERVRHVDLLAIAAEVEAKWQAHREAFGLAA